MVKSRLRWGLGGTLLFCLLAACRATSTTALPYVDLSARSSLPVAAEIGERPLLVAVGAILSPQGTIDSYRKFAEYLSTELARPVEIVQRRTYAETNALIAQGEVDIGFVCTGAYLDGDANQTLDLLVAPEIAGQSVYYSNLIVPAESSARSMADLEGRNFAFTDPMSLSGRIYPTHLVQSLGNQPERFFATISYTYSHERAIEAVADGVVDGAAVDSLVLQYAYQRDVDLAAKIRIIHVSPAFGVPPVVAPVAASLRQRTSLQAILLSMHETEYGQHVLEDLGIDRFVLIEDRAYESARHLLASTEYLP